MPFDWRFYTEGLPFSGEERKCFRGPMIPVEVTMSQEFSTLLEMESVRKRLLNTIVDTKENPVRTREVILRVLHSNLGPAFTLLRNVQADLDVTVCSKRSSIDIDKELTPWNRDFESALRSLSNHGVPKMTIDLIMTALRSLSAPYRVAGRCAVVLLAAFVEGA